MKKQKCVYCSKMVRVSKSGNFLSHLADAKKCVGVGFSAERCRRQVEALNALRREDEHPRNLPRDR